MKPKTLILMVVAVACGLAASYMTSRLLAERGPEQQKSVKILVAKKNLDTGLNVKVPLDMFHEKMVAEENVPQFAITSLDELKGRVLKRSLRKDDFVTLNDLLNDKDTILDNMLAPGYQALGIRVNVDTSAGGFASLPLSRVDVYATVRRGDDKKSFTALLLQNVLVLAADTKASRPEDGQGAIVATTVTVALKPEDILKVNLVKDFGTLNLALRKFGDTARSEHSVLTFEDLVGGTKSGKDTTEIAEVLPTTPKEKLETPIQPTKTSTHQVWQFNGDRVDLVEFRFDEEGNVLSSRVIQRGGERVDGPSAIGPTPPAPKQGVNP